MLEDSEVDPMSGWRSPGQQGITLGRCLFDVLHPKEIRLHP